MLQDCWLKLFRDIVFPVSKCKLRLLKLERIKDYLLMEEEFIRNQEVLKPREEQNEVFTALLALYQIFIATTSSI